MSEKEYLRNHYGDDITDTIFFRETRYGDGAGCTYTIYAYKSIQLHEELGRIQIEVRRSFSFFHRKDAPSDSCMGVARAQLITELKQKEDKVMSRSTEVGKLRKLLIEAGVEVGEHKVGHE